MIPALIDQPRELVEAAAYVAGGVAEIDDVAAEVGMTAGELIARLSDPELQRAVDAEAARLKRSGKMTEARGMALLWKALDCIESQLDTMPAATATRVAEILLRVSGLQDRRAAALRVPEAVVGAGFSITINLPSPEKGVGVHVIDGTSRGINHDC